MSDGSEYSFEYEDEDEQSVNAFSESEDESHHYHNHGDGYNEGTLLVSSPHANPIDATLEDLLLDQKSRPQRSPNALSTAVFRPLSVASYIYDHMVRPGLRLQQTFLPGFSLEEAILLLHYKRWSVDEVTGAYFDDWPRLRDACGLPVSRGVVHEIRASRHFACPICCESGSSQVFSLSCGHEFCAPCYKRYVASMLSRGALLRCMDPKCNLSLHYSDISSLLAVQLPEDDPEYLGQLPSELNSAEVLVDPRNESRKEGYLNRSVDTNCPHNVDAPAAEFSRSSGNHDDHDASDGSDASYISDSPDEYDSQFNNLDPLHYTSNALEKKEPLSQNPLLVAAARVSIDTMHARYRWCPSVDCSQLVEFIGDRGRNVSAEQVPKSDLSAISIVTCSNNHEFCFDCHYENHLPCPCWLAKIWIKRCEDDSETVNWIDANTQSCPKCQAVIEKNGGCNHMVCQKCNNEFCWICLGDWAVHKSNWWQCNRFDPKEVEEVKKKRSEKQNSLSRYLHFYRRFSVHQVSMNGDTKTLKRVHRCMLHYMKAQTLSSDRPGSWNDVQFLSDAIRSLSSGRKTLMWTYAFVFYLKKSNYSEIFEGMQDFLNKTVEDLSRLFEKVTVIDMPENTAARITSKKSEIMSLASLVTRRRDLLIECAQTGIQQGTLSFISP